jgi:hypothetical protein
MSNISTLYEQFLDKHILLPQRNLWSRRAIAEYLEADKNTIKLYAEDIAVVVKDYLDICPRGVDGSLIRGFSLSQYQFWVLVKIIKLGRLIRVDMNGKPYRKDLKKLVAIKQDYFSKQAWQRDMQLHNSDAA